GFTEEQKLFAEGVRKFARAHLEKDALERAHDPCFPFEVARLMHAQGLMGITIPEADGGVGGNLMDAVIAIEQVAAVCPRSAAVAFHERGGMERAPFRELPGAGGERPPRTGRFQEADRELQRRAARKFGARAGPRTLCLRQGTRLRRNAPAIRPAAL